MRCTSRRGGSPGWFTTRKTVDDTRRDAPGETGEAIIAAEQVAQDLARGDAEGVR